MMTKTQNCLNIHDHLADQFGDHHDDPKLFNVWKSESCFGFSGSAHIAADTDSRLGNQFSDIWDAWEKLLNLSKIRPRLFSCLLKSISYFEYCVESEKSSERKQLIILNALGQFQNGIEEENNKKNENINIETPLTRAAILNWTGIGLCWVG